MAWVAPITFVAGVPLTAAQLNAMQSNLLETAVAKATSAGQYPVATGTNALAMRKAVSAVTNVIGSGHTGTSYSATAGTTGGTGPNCVVTTGAMAAVFLYSLLSNNTFGQATWYSYSISGATTTTASDLRAIGSTLNAPTIFGALAFLHTGLVPGSNSFDGAYRVAGGTGQYDNRQITVLPF